MAIKLTEMTYNSWRYGDHVKAIVEYLKKYWNIKALPKGYRNFIKNRYENDELGQCAEDEARLLKEFKGHDSSGVIDSSIVYRLHRAQVGYDDREQGRDPFYVLVGSIMAYGMNAGARLERTNDSSESNCRLKFSHHARDRMGWAQQDGDEEKAELARQEYEDYCNLKIDMHDTMDKYRRLGHELKRRRALCLLKEMRLKGKLVLVQSDYKRLGRLWKYMHGICCGYGWKENPVFTEMKPMLKELGLKVKKSNDNTVYTFTLIKGKK